MVRNEENLPAPPNDPGLQPQVYPPVNSWGQSAETMSNASYRTAPYEMNPDPKPIDPHHHHHHEPSKPPPVSFPPAANTSHAVQFPPPHPEEVHHMPPGGGGAPAVNFPPPPEAFHRPNVAPFPQPPPPNFQPSSMNMGSPFGAQPGIPVPQMMAAPSEPWKSGLFDCMNNPENAIITACFPCVTFGQIAEILDHGQTSCGTSGCLYGTIGFCIGIPCIMSCGYRTKLRNQFGLVESPAPDWIVHCFCEWCALCQEYRELKDRGLDPTLGWQGNVMKQMQMTPMTPPMHPMMGR